MYSFNHRLDPKTFLAMPIKAAQGAGVSALVLFTVIGLRSLVAALVLLPVLVLGIRLMIRGFKEYNEEHLLRLKSEYRKKDAVCTDLNFRGR
jgi:hypothetical protein